jgi:putative SOS response-associated peptidase YedK
MCGRFTLIRLSDFTNLFPWILPPDSPPPPRYNIAPSQPIAVVPNVGQPKVDYYRWGLIPHWAKDPSIGNRMINARAETLAGKPAFKAALARRRCLIPADGFYEWKKAGKKKMPLRISLRSGKPFAFAGLWEIWHDPGGSAIPTCTIITTGPNELMAPIHDRMPAIIPEDRYHDWINPAESPPEAFTALLTPYPAEEMTAQPVSPMINNANANPASLDEITSFSAPPQAEADCKQLPTLFD